MKKDPNVVYVKPTKMIKTLERLGQTIKDLLDIHKDRDFFTDNQKDWDDIKTQLVDRSTDPQDHKDILEQDLDKISRDIIQVSLFGRILKTNEDKIVNNLPPLHFPVYMRHFLSGGTTMDLYDISSYKTLEIFDIIKKVRSKDEKKKSK